MPHVELTPSNIAQVVGDKIPTPVLESVATTIKWASEYRGSSDYPHIAWGYLKEADRAGKFGVEAGRTYAYAFKLNLSYALGNLQQWRGDEARAVKKILNKYANESD